MPHREQDRRRKTDIVKEAIKEGMKEWMNESYTRVKIKIGTWAIRCFCIFGFCLFVKALIFFNIGSLRTFTEEANKMLAETLLDPIGAGK